MLLGCQMCEETLLRKMISDIFKKSNEKERKILAKKITLKEERISFFQVLIFDGQSSLKIKKEKEIKKMKERFFVI